MKEEKRVVRGFPQKMTARSFSTDVREDENLSGCNEVTVLATAYASVQNKDRSCVLCGRSHILESCGQFHKMKLADRKAFLRKKRFCYGCMDGRHLSRTCSKRKECQTCGGLHPTLLHYDARQEGKETTEADTNVTAHYTKASAASVISQQIDIFYVAGH